LHAAVRVLLPILPSLSASSPILDGEITLWKDARLEEYSHNQEAIPQIAGHIIPEAVFSEAEYQSDIFSPIMREMERYDEEGVLEKHFVNSRGAIARFDRGAIEIRIIDIQECPRADMAILRAIVAVLKGLAGERWSSLEEQKAWDERELKTILTDHIRHAEEALIENEAYLHLFGIDSKVMKSKEVWGHLVKACELEDPALDYILKTGSLSTRMLRALPKQPSEGEIQNLFFKLAQCLAENTLFKP